MNKMNRYEENNLKKEHQKPQILFKTFALSKMTFFSELSNNPNKKFFNLTASVIAPLLNSFVAWVFKDAEEKGFKRLYFVSRDGQIMHKIAQKMSGHFNNAVECRYLYGSRQAWFLPSITQCTKEELSWLASPSTSTTIRSILERLDIKPEEIAIWLKKYNLDGQLDEQLTPRTLGKVWMLIEETEFSNLILKKAEEYRQLAIQYFKQEGLFSTEKWALVDVGWALKCQYSLKKILIQGGHLNPIHGYYLGVRNHGFNYESINEYRAFLSEKERENKWLFKGAFMIMIDNIFTASDHGSVIGYKKKDDKKLIPILKNQKQDTHLAEQIQKVVLSYTNHLLNNNLLPNHIDELTESALQNLKIFLLNPNKEDIEPLLNYLVCSEQTHEARHFRRLVYSIHFHDLVKILLCEIKKNHYDQSLPIWLEGSAVLSPFPIKQILKMLIKIKRFFNK